MKILRIILLNVQEGHTEKGLQYMRSGWQPEVIILMTVIGQILMSMMSPASR